MSNYPNLDIMEKALIVKEVNKIYRSNDKEVIRKSLNLILKLNGINEIIKGD